ncbi:MAG: amidase [Chloroflexi bacterium]|nr:MAG: amidase [Chloroflexota bacterium]
MESELTRLTLAEASSLVRHKKVSPLELTEACLRGIEESDSQLNAFITVAADEAVMSAGRAGEEIAKGDHRGPLHGIPVAVKDLLDRAGARTTYGSKIFAEHVPSADAAAVERLLKEGAVLLGKLNLHEFAFGATGINAHHGACRNPWDTERITGGSSSGSGAAVAAGQCFAALGTDTGGSIRIPASVCGVAGIKPTYGRVSRRGVLPLSWSLDHVGPLARSVEDCAIMLQAIAGDDPADASSSAESVPDYRAALSGGVRGLRVGVPSEFFFDGADPEVGNAVRAAIDVLSGLGATMHDVSLPHIAQAPAAVTAIMLPEALSIHQQRLAERPGDYGDDVPYRLELGATFTALDYVTSQRFREMIVAEWRRDVFDKVDVLATPATPVTAGRIDKGDLQTTFSLIHNTNPLNLLGIPAISVPCGFTSSGLPIGLQLAGRWWDEATVLRAAHAYERATEWHKRHPPR